MEAMGRGSPRAGAMQTARCRKGRDHQGHAGAGRAVTDIASIGNSALALREPNRSSAKTR